MPAAVGSFGILAYACRKSNPDILVVQSTQDRTAKNVSGALNGARAGASMSNDGCVRTSLQ